MGKSLGEYLQSEFPYDTDTKNRAKDVVREWLENVSLPEMGNEESTRKLLVFLVDEPE